MLEVTVLLLVSLLQSLQVLQLIHKVVHLGLQIMNFCFSLSQLSLLVLLVIALLVYLSIHLLHFI